MQVGNKKQHEPIPPISTQETMEIILQIAASLAGVISGQTLRAVVCRKPVGGSYITVPGSGTLHRAGSLAFSRRSWPEWTHLKRRLC